MGAADRVIQLLQDLGDAQHFDMPARGLECLEVAGDAFVGQDPGIGILAPEGPVGGGPVRAMAVSTKGNNKSRSTAASRAGADGPIRGG
jgi:hypothetical protein